VNQQPIKTIKGYNIAAIHRQYGNFILDCIRLSGVSSVDDALDIRQNIYLGLFRRSISAKLPNSQSLVGYIRRCIKHAVVDFRKSQVRENIMFDWTRNGKEDVIGRKMDDISFANWLKLNRDVESRILKALEFLNEYSCTPAVSMREIIADVYDGKTADEIAERFNTKAGTVFSWISRFRDDLRRHMMKGGVFDDVS
jgi:DNA-directed RNA polymerase specialized sigma24 family protein